MTGRPTTCELTKNNLSSKLATNLFNNLNLAEIVFFKYINPCFVSLRNCGRI